MEAKNNRIEKLEHTAQRQARFSIRELTIGVASVLLGITLLFGGNVKEAKAETIDANDNQNAVAQDKNTKQQTAGEGVVTEADPAVQDDIDSKTVVQDTVQPSVKVESDQLENSQVVVSNEDAEQSTKSDQDVDDSKKPVQSIQHETETSTPVEKKAETENSNANSFQINPNDLNLSKGDDSQIAASLQNVTDAREPAGEINIDLKIIDDTTGKTLKTYNQTATSPYQFVDFGDKPFEVTFFEDESDIKNYPKPEDNVVLNQVKDYENQGYKLVSSDYHPFYSDKYGIKDGDTYFAVKKDVFPPQDGYPENTVYLATYTATKRKDIFTNQNVKEVVYSYLLAEDPNQFSWPDISHPFASYSKHYEIHLTHTTSPTSKDESVTRTIQYVYQDGTKAAKDQVDTLNFTDKGTTDNVTHDTAWQGWDPAVDQFDAVDSPSIDGYYADKKQVKSQIVTPTSKDIVETVTYTKDPAAQIIYRDVNDPSNIEILSKSPVQTGKAGTVIDYNPQSNLDNYVSQGYVLKNDEFAPGQEAYDNNDQGMQIFNIDFVHGTEDKQVTKDSTQTIIYHYSDGQKPDTQTKQTDHGTFTSTQTIDKVTKKVISTTPWIGDHTFSVVDTPVVDGYHADKKTAGGLTATVDHPDVTETVIYTPDDKKTPITPEKKKPTEPNDPPTIPSAPTVPSNPPATPDDHQPTNTPNQDEVTVDDNSDQPADDYNNTFAPHAAEADESDNTPVVKKLVQKHASTNENISPKGEQVPKSSPVVNDSGKAVDYVKAADQVDYVLPQTGIDDHDSDMAAVLGAGAIAISMIGLAGVKKRRQ